MTSGIQFKEAIDTVVLIDKNIFVNHILTFFITCTIVNRYPLNVVHALSTYSSTGCTVSSSRAFENTRAGMFMISKMFVLCDLLGHSSSYILNSLPVCVIFSKLPVVT